MLLTLSQVKDSTATNISGVCPNSDEFIALLNDATRMLMRRGDWPGTIVPIHVCVKNGCVTFPRYVGNIRAINRCGIPMPISNNWYQFIQKSDYDSCCSESCNVEFMGRFPTFTDILGDGRLIRAYPSVSEDVGKSVKIFGVDNNDQTLRTQNPNGTWTDGITIEMLNPFGTTSVYVRRIDRILKEETEGDVFMYAYNVAGDVLEDLVVLEPGEINPSFARYSINTSCIDSGEACSCSGSSCSSSKSIVAMVKLQFVPVRYDEDMVLIENIDALKMMMQSIKHREAGDRQAAIADEQDAIRELNLDITNQSPDWHTPVSIEPFNGLDFSIHHVS